MLRRWLCWISPQIGGRCLYLESSSGSLAKLTSNRRASSLVSRLAAVRQPGLLLIVEIAELLSVLVADDEAGVYSSRRWGRAAGSGGGMSRLLRPVVKPRNLVCRISDRPADQLDGRSRLLLRGQSLPSQHGLLQRGAIGLGACTVVQRGGALGLAISVARNPCRNAIKISVASR